MSVYEDNRYDITVECKQCHDMHDYEVQLFSKSEIAIEREILDNLFTLYQNCGAEKTSLVITTTNKYFTVEEIRRLRENRNI